MASLWIVEFERMAKDQYGHGIQAGEEPPVAIQAVSISGTSAQSAALNAKTKFVALIADAACNFLFGADPTADASDEYLPANSEIYRGIAPNQAGTVKIAAKTVA